MNGTGTKNLISDLTKYYLADPIASQGHILKFGEYYSAKKRKVIGASNTKINQCFRSKMKRLIENKAEKI